METNTAAAFLTMQRAAVSDGIDLQICSGYRNFEKQLSIWNAKASGKRVLLNRESQPVSIESLSSNQLINLILIWSAIPGMSRHHWGTDIDIFDANKISREQLRLIPSEYQVNGPCFELNQWLNKHAQDYGFYRPYQPQLSGVSPEPWHLSYFPISAAYLEAYDLQSVKSVLASSDILEKETILAQLESLINEYVIRVAPIPNSQ
nr:M15 family metallopeptidase [Shewanella schlegeliana]